MTPAVLPATFTVGALYPSGLAAGGRLVVDKGSVVLIPDRVTRAGSKLLTWDKGEPDVHQHQGATITVLLSRIPTPVANTTVLLDGSPTSTVAASVPPWLRRPLLSALRTAGFEVREEKHLLTNGLSRVK